MNKNQSSSNLSGKSREELKYIAKSIDLNKYDNYNILNKKELIKLIELKKETNNLPKLTKANLNKIAINYGINNYSNLSKNELSSQISEKKFIYFNRIIHKDRENKNKLIISNISREEYKESVNTPYGIFTSIIDTQNNKIKSQKYLTILKEKIDETVKKYINGRSKSALFKKIEEGSYNIIYKIPDNPLVLRLAGLKNAKRISLEINGYNFMKSLRKDRCPNILPIYTYGYLLKNKKHYYSNNKPINEYYGEMERIRRSENATIKNNEEEIINNEATNNKIDKFSYAILPYIKTSLKDYIKNIRKKDLHILESNITFRPESIKQFFHNPPGENFNFENYKKYINKKSSNYLISAQTNYKRVIMEFTYLFWTYLQYRTNEFNMSRMYIINYELINQNIRNILTISKEIVKTLKWFRRNNLVHLDIKPSNIMIDENNSINSLNNINIGKKKNSTTSSLLSYFTSNTSSVSSNNNNSNNNLKIYFTDFSEMSNASDKKNFKKFGTEKYLPKISQENNMKSYDTFAVLFTIYEMIENSLYNFNILLPDVGLQNQKKNYVSDKAFSKYLIEYIDVNQRKLFSYLIFQYIGIPYFLPYLEIDSYTIREKQENGNWKTSKEEKFAPFKLKYDNHKQSLERKKRNSNLINSLQFKNKEDDFKNFWELIANLEQLSKLIKVDIMGQVSFNKNDKIKFMKKIYNLYTEDIKAEARPPKKKESGVMI